MTAAGVPLPQISPLRRGTAAAARQHPRRSRRAPRIDGAGPDHDRPRHQGLRLWIGTASTRQKSYALLTMPDFAQRRT